MHTRFFRKLVNSAEFYTALQRVTVILSALVILPVATVTLSTAQFGTWMYFATLGALAQLFELGISAVVASALAYFRSGAKTFPNNPEQLRKLYEELPPGREMNWPMVAEVIGTLKWTLRGLAFLMLFPTAFLAWFVSRNLIEGAEAPMEIYAALGLYIVSLFMSMSGNTALASIHRGFDLVVAETRNNTIAQLCRTVLVLVLLVSGAGVVGIAGSFVLAALFLHLLYRRSLRRHNPQLLEPRTFSRRALKMLLPALSHLGVEGIGRFLLSHGTDIVISRIPDPKLITGYLLLKRLYAMASTFTTLLLDSRVPYLNYLRANGKLKEYREFAFPRFGLVLSATVVVVPAISFLLEPLLELINRADSFTIPATPILCVMILAELNRLHMFTHRGLYLSTNHFIFVWPLMLTSCVVLAVQFLLVEQGGLMSIVLANLLLTFFGIHFFIVHLNLKSLDLSFLRYLWLLLTWPRMIDRIFKSKPHSPPN